MDRVDRFKILIRYIKDNGLANSQKELGKSLGYNNESYFSQIVNGQVEEPKELGAKLKNLVPNLNINWLHSGDGEMIFGDNETREIKDDTSDLRTRIAVLEKENELLREQNEFLKTLLNK